MLLTHNITLSAEEIPAPEILPIQTFGNTKAVLNHYLSAGVVEYQKSNFNEALENFLSAETAGLRTPELLYNIGNSYFMLNDIPMAIIYFRRALMMNSSFQPAQKNLQFVMSITRDNQLGDTGNPTNENLLANLIMKIYYFFSINALLILSLCILTIIILIVHIQWKFINLDRTVLRFINFVLLFIFLIASALLISRIYIVANNNEAVITETAVNVMSGPSDGFTRLFTIHTGTVIKIQKIEDDWTQMRTLTGYSGWIKTETYKKIREE
jgi:tetratricopeptide (TPR) repeat protein